MKRFVKVFRPPSSLGMTQALVQDVSSSRGRGGSNSGGSSSSGGGRVASHPRQTFLNAQELIIYEDNHLLVMFKPPTVLSQGDSTRDDSLLDAAKRYLVKSNNKPGDAFLGMVHRLDRPCSGVIAFGKTSKCAMRLSEALRERHDGLKKEYLCVVNGIVERPGSCHHWMEVGGMKTTVWDQPVHPQDKRLLEARLKYFPVAHQKGKGKWSKKRGRTPFAGSSSSSNSSSGNHGGRLSQYSPYNLSLVRVELETGRKHQIRAQMSYSGHPIVGDGKYGAPQVLRDIPLHSHMLEFEHPTREDTLMSFYSFPPEVWAVRYGAEIDKGVQSLIPHLQEYEQLIES